MPSSRTVAIEQHLASARTALAELTRERDEAVLGLLAAPGDTILATTLDQLRVELPAAEGRVQELESVLQRAQTADTVEGRTAERARLHLLRQNAAALAQARADLATKIDAHLRALGPLLKKWAAAGEQASKPLREFMRGACPDPTTRKVYASDELMRMADGTSSMFGAALTNQLANTGLFIEGVPLPTIADALYRHNPRSGLTVEQAACMAADKLDKVLGKFDQLADDLLLDEKATERHAATRAKAEAKVDAMRAKVEA